MRQLLSTFIAVSMGLVLVSSAVFAEDIQIGLSEERIAITSSFDGQNIVLFGTIEGGQEEALQNGRYDIAVIVEGPESDVVIRRKERSVGIWVNGASRSLRRNPTIKSVE